MRAAIRSSEYYRAGTRIGEELAKSLSKDDIESLRDMKRLLNSLSTQLAVGFVEGFNNSFRTRKKRALIGLSDEEDKALMESLYMEGKNANV